MSKLADQSAVESAIAACAAFLLKLDKSVLVVLPGEAEIDRPHVELTSSRNVEAQFVDKLHGDMSDYDIQRVLHYQGPHRIVLSSNIAETAVTIPDIDAVLDSGLSRHIDHQYDLPYTMDYITPEVARKQREGRAGRVHPGSCIRFYMDEVLPPHDSLPLSRSDVTRILALEGSHSQIRLRDCRFAFVTEDDITLRPPELREASVD